jgi:hypothetical protein
MNRPVIIAFVLLCTAVALSGWYGPWYAPAVVVVIICALLSLRTAQAIWLGLISCAFVYTLVALIMLNRDDAGIISKTGNLLGGLSPIMVILITAVTGSLTGLFAGWMGSALGKIVRHSTN